MNDAFMTEYAWAFDRVRVKRALSDSLQALPDAAQQEVLIELLAERLEGAVKAAPGRVRQLPPESEATAASPSAEPEPAARIAPRPTLLAKGSRSSKKGARRGRPPKRRGKQSPGRTDTLVTVLRDSPGISIADLSMRVYGDSSGETTAKTRSLLHALKKQGKVESRGAGQWEVASA